MMYVPMNKGIKVTRMTKGAVALVNKAVGNVKKPKSNTPPALNNKYGFGKDEVPGIMPKRAPIPATPSMKRNNPGRLTLPKQRLPTPGTSKQNWFAISTN